MQKKTTPSALRDLMVFTQIGFSMVIPPVFCAIVSWWLANRFSLGNWVVVLAVLLGAGASCLNLWNFAKSAQQKANESERDKRK